MLMELLIMVDAAKRASARTITAVVSHYGYARQDKKSAAREPITAKLVADLMTVSGVSRVITMDLHQGQIQGFFNQPVNHLTALPILADYFESLHLDNLCVVSPDVGRAKACKKLADMLGASLAIMHKGRPDHNVAEITHVIGEVEGKNCIIADDMIDTAGSVVAGAKALKNAGADTVYVTATHGILSEPAFDRLAGVRGRGGRRHQHDPAAREVRRTARSTCSRWRRCSRTPYRTCSTTSPCRSSSTRISSSRPSQTGRVGRYHSATQHAGEGAR